MKHTIAVVPEVPLPAKHIVVITGYTGVGKSILATYLVRELHRPTVERDDAFPSLYARPIDTPKAPQAPQEVIVAGA